MHQATFRGKVTEVQGDFFLIKIEVEQYGYSIDKDSSSFGQGSIKGQDNKSAHFTLKLS